MCGIVAYIGQQEAFPIIVDGLKKLEYRGYDSSGVALMNGSLSLLKKEGKVADLVKYAEHKKTDGNIGLGHTRWATHGKPSDINSHPHQSQTGRLTMVHNGIIENYAELRNKLRNSGYYFQSDTDTEVFVQLIQYYIDTRNCSTKVALQYSLQEVIGSYAIVLFDLENPTQLLAARRKSPLVLGTANDEIFISSDPMTIAAHTDRVIYLEEDIISEVRLHGELSFYDLNLCQIHQCVSIVNCESMESTKGNFGTYMLKEIHEQPHKIGQILTGHTWSAPATLFENIDRIIITACGTSWHSGLLAEYYIEKLSRINVEVEYASEFRYKNPILSPRDLVIGISQSGETADTIAALELAKENGCQTIGLVNVTHSTIARMVDYVLPIAVGPEIGVASTKAFTGQLSHILNMAIGLGVSRGMLDQSMLEDVLKDIKELPEKINHILSNHTTLKRVAQSIKDAHTAIFLGRGDLFPAALEGALKIKEISYIHAEGYPAGEMKHGPIALIDDGVPVIALVNNDTHLEKLLSNVAEVKARKAKVILVKNESTIIPDDLADYVINVPDCHTSLNGMLQSIPLQLLAYYTARLKGCNVDQPRNLAKSVTVE